MSSIRAFRLFLRLGARQQVLLFEASAALAASRLKLAVFPFPRVARGLGRFSAQGPPNAFETALTLEQLEAVREVRWAVRVAARRMPFQSLCLQQAMAAHSMLRRRGIEAVLHLGAASGEKEPMWAHAWLDAGGLRVTGYPIAPDIVEIGCFT